MARNDGRDVKDLRDIKFTRNWLDHAEGSVLVEFGKTRVLCVASFSPGVPRWLKDSGKGWVTSEYSMLPRATHTRSDRESVKGKLGGRTQEISRLVGRSLRAIVNMQELGESIAKKSGGTVEVIHDADEAARGASVLYTDVWMSMGDSESDRKEKVAALSPFSVTDSLMAATEKDSIFMHCLPAHRGEEVSASVIDGPRSVIWREAYHRRTTIQALLYHLSRGELVGSK